MATITVPLAHAGLAQLSAVAEQSGAGADQYLRARAEGFAKHLTPRRSRAEIEAELRAQLSVIPLSEMDAPDPELDALAGIITGKVPDDYWDLVVEKYL